MRAVWAATRARLRAHPDGPVIPDTQTGHHTDLPLPTLHTPLTPHSPHSLQVPHDVRRLALPGGHGPGGRQPGAGGHEVRRAAPRSAVRLPPAAAGATRLRCSAAVLLCCCGLQPAKGPWRSSSQHRPGTHNEPGSEASTSCCTVRANILQRNLQPHPNGSTAPPSPPSPPAPTPTCTHPHPRRALASLAATSTSGPRTQRSATPRSSTTWWSCA
jgi:hypothetical protein